MQVEVIESIESMQWYLQKCLRFKFMLEWKSVSQSMFIWYGN